MESLSSSSKPNPALIHSSSFTILWILLVVSTSPFCLRLISLPEISLTTWFVRIAFDMTFQQELSSWAFPKSVSTSPVPEIWSKAPSSSKLSLPSSDRKPTIITFLRHCVALVISRFPRSPCGKHTANSISVAEKTFRNLRDISSKDPSKNFVAVSHSSDPATKDWLDSIGGKGNVRIIVDDKRELYGKWGLGVSSTWHVLNP